MKALTISIILIISSALYAQTNYCGQMTSVSYQTDIYSVIRMGLANPERDPKVLTIKDESTIESVIGLITNQPDYRHKSDSDDYAWDVKTSSDKYFVCATGELYQYRNNFYMKAVQSFAVWKNGKKMSLNSTVPVNETAVCESLKNQAEESCTKYMCEEAGVTLEECTKDGDFYEGLQVCMDDEMTALIEAYNKKNPAKQVSCEE